MSSENDADDSLSLQRAIIIAVVLLATPFVAFVLIALALTTDTGLAGWFLVVVLPLSLLATGLWLLAGETLDLTYWVRKSA